MKEKTLVRIAIYDEEDVYLKLTKEEIELLKFLDEDIQVIRDDTRIDYNVEMPTVIQFGRKEV